MDSISTDKQIAAFNRLREALQMIAAIPNQETGCDWDEINEARTIAQEALDSLED